MLKIKIVFVVLFFAFIGQIKAQLSLGIEGGALVSNVYGKESSSSGSNVGFTIGMVGSYDFRSDMGILSGIYLKNATVADKGIAYNEIYLHVPVHYAYRFYLTSNSRLALHAGPYAALGIFKKETNKNFKDFKVGGTGNIDAGLGIGVNYQIDNFLLNIGYDFGFTKIDIPKNVVKNKAFTFSIGYLF